MQKAGTIFCEESDKPKKKNVKAKELYMNTYSLVGRFVSHWGTGEQFQNYFMCIQVLNK